MSFSADITRPAYLDEPGMHEVSAAFDAFRDSVTRAKRVRDTEEANTEEANTPEAKRMRLKDELKNELKEELREELVVQIKMDIEADAATVPETPTAQDEQWATQNEELLKYKKSLNDTLVMMMELQDALCTSKEKVAGLEGALEASKEETRLASENATKRGRDRDQCAEDYNNIWLLLQNAKKKIATFEKQKADRRAARRAAHEAAQADQAAREAEEQATREAEDAKSAKWLFW